MKRSLWIALVFMGETMLCEPTAAMAQTFEIYNGDTVNLVDATGLKQGLWIFWGKDKKEFECEPEKKVEEGEFVDDRKDGLWKQYYCNGKVKNEITYAANRANGYAKFYYKNGKVSEEGTWKNNKWHGDYKFYHENGNVAYEWHYENGKRQGQQKYYHDNGKVMIEGTWNGGKEEGVQKEYYADGTLKAEKNYNGGQLDATTSKFYEKKEPERTEAPAEVAENTKTRTLNEIPSEVSDLAIFTGSGNHKLYNKRKQIWKDGFFEGGRLITGKVYQYDSRGRLERVAVFKNGILIQEEIPE